MVLMQCKDVAIVGKKALKFDYAKTKIMLSIMLKYQQHPYNPFITLGILDLHQLFCAKACAELLFVAQLSPDSLFVPLERLQSQLLRTAFQMAHCVPNMVVHQEAAEIRMETCAQLCLFSFSINVNAIEFRGGSGILILGWQL